MKQKLILLAAIALLSLSASAQNLVIQATNLPGPGYSVWTNFVAKYNQAAGTNKTLNVPGFNYWQTNIVAAVTNEAGQVVTPGSTNVVEVHPKMTSAQLLAEFGESAEFKRLAGEALTLYLARKRGEILDQVEFNWWSGIK